MLAALACLAPFLAPADWELVGGAGVSEGTGLCCQIAFAPDGTPHVAYQDGGLASIPASVQRFDGASWSYVGARGQASLGAAWYNRLAFDGAGRVHLVCRDYAVGGKMSLRRFDAASGLWESVGQPGATPNEAHYTDVAIGTDGVPYVVFADRNTVPADRASVRRFSQGAWTYLGGPGLSPQGASYTRVAVDGQGAVLVAFADARFADANGQGKATVMRWDPAAPGWTTVGAPGFTALGALNLALALDGEGQPWIAYHAYHSAIRVHRFVGGSWLPVGGSASAADRPTVETEPWRQWLSLAFDSQDRPYVAYQRWDFGGRAAVRRLEAGAWQPVGNLGFTAGSADYMAFAIDPFDVPWIVCRDAGNAYRVTVMRYRPSPERYCGPDLGAHACAVSIEASGTPGVTSGGPFELVATGVPPGASGMLLHALRPDRAPFEGGVLCLAPPWRRSAMATASGMSGGSPCSGRLAVDFVRILRSGAHPDLVPGRWVFAQFVHRSASAAEPFRASDALRFEIGP